MPPPHAKRISSVCLLNWKFTLILTRIARAWSAGGKCYMFAVNGSGGGTVVVAFEVFELPFFPIFAIVRATLLCVKFY